MAVTFSIGDSFEDRGQMLTNAAAASAVAAAMLELVPHDAALAAAAGVRHALDDAEPAEVVTAVAAAAAAAFGSATPSRGSGRAAWAAAVGAAYGHAAHIMRQGGLAVGNSIRGGKDAFSPVDGGRGSDEKVEEDGDVVAAKITAAVAAASAANVMAMQVESAAAEAAAMTQAAFAAPAAAAAQADAAAPAPSSRVKMRMVPHRPDVETTMDTTASLDAEDYTSSASATSEENCSMASMALVVDATTALVGPNATSQSGDAAQALMADQFMLKAAVSECADGGDVAANESKQLQTLSKIQPGDLVQICGLHKVPRFNGMMVKCEEFCVEKGAWLVVLKFGTERTKFYLKDHNIMPFNLKEGSDSCRSGDSLHGSGFASCGAGGGGDTRVGTPVVAGAARHVEEKKGERGEDHGVVAPVCQRRVCDLPREATRGRVGLGCVREPSSGRGKSSDARARRRDHGGGHVSAACGGIGLEEEERVEEKQEDADHSVATRTCCRRGSGPLGEASRGCEEEEKRVEEKEGDADHSVALFTFRRRGSGPLGDASRGCASGDGCSLH
eukprot:TRINITY_DN15245_c0_g6_i1.p1 TRINITY_DN15245_c0_g6~~TRINITY_DN15245_c0_g6_i1.p1  ORF type:complete len:558 (-),score=126.60 TRINITY_DN15245_c0_g6_i1:461-2134(-)